MIRVKNKFVRPVIMMASLIVLAHVIYGQTNNLENISKIIDNYRAKHGTAMNFDTFFDLVIENKLTGLEVRDAWSRLAQNQDPLITKSELRELIRAKKEVISTLSCEYDQEKFQDNQYSLERKKYAFDGRKVFSEFSKGSNQDDMKLIYCSSFDGKVWRDLQVNEEKRGAGTISHNDLTKRIYKSNDFLKLCMLRETPEGLQKLQSYDLVSFLNSEAAVIQEELVTVNGTNCLLITNGVTYIYLNPEKDFTVMKVESSSMQRGENMSILDRNTNYSRTYSDFLEYVNGIWLPRHIEEISHKYNQKIFTNVLNVKVNEPIDNKLFQNIFPDGVFVNDETKGIMYRLGAPESIEQLIEEDLKKLNDYTQVNDVNSSTTEDDDKSRVSVVSKQEDNNPGVLVLGKTHRKGWMSYLIFALVCLLALIVVFYVYKRRIWKGVRHEKVTS